MNQNIFCNPKLLIDGRVVNSLISTNYNDTGGNKLSTLFSKFSEPDLEGISLFNKRVEFYLNYGSEDSYPLFRGYIKGYTAKDADFSINALDVRTLITGKESYPVVVDDKKNYDGHTVAQFLIDTIDNDINISEGLSTDATNDMDKPMYMTGYRGKDPVYDIVRKVVEAQLDEDDILNTQSYFLDVLHGETSSSVVFRKTVDVSEQIDMNFSYFDGLKSLTYKKRPAPSFGICQTTSGEQVRFDYGNSPEGKTGVRLEGRNYNSRGEAKEALIPYVLSKQDSEIDININTSKGHYLSIGNVVRLDVPDVVEGSYRVTSKAITYNKNGTLSCSLSLNKVPINLSDYLLP
tara:strand:- start:330 stop:1373 length:1044 start_codon:yes stop_codon:yes gene_type:complete